MLYIIVNFTTRCGENRHTDIANFATLIHAKKLVHCVAIFTILYGNVYPSHGEFKLICIWKFARWTWVNFPQQYGKIVKGFNKIHFIWQLLFYFYREFLSKILSVYSMAKGLHKPITNGVFHYTVLARVPILWKKTAHCAPLPSTYVCSVAERGI